MANSFRLAELLPQWLVENSLQLISLFDSPWRKVVQIRNNNGFSHSKISLGTNQDTVKCYIVNILYTLIEDGNLLENRVINNQLK